MRILNSCLIAISMYSRIPVPGLKWEEENMRYSLGFFPVVGIVVGILEILWYRIASWFAWTNLFYAVVACLIPLLVTGGIHMDGFCDTEDALSSCQIKERKLEILKDPHAGAFALIRCGMYLLAYTGAMSLVDSSEKIELVAVGYVLSRVCSGLAAVTFPAAKKNGSLATFSHASDKKIVRILLTLTAAVCAALMLLIRLDAGIITLAFVALLFAYYYHMSRKQFGGITGDLAGWFLQMCELVILFAVTVGIAVLDKI
jgi:adenosylcobinamide-GDP ribazoletransferase